MGVLRTTEVMRVVGTTEVMRVVGTKEMIEGDECGGNDRGDKGDERWGRQR